MAMDSDSETLENRLEDMREVEENKTRFPPDFLFVRRWMLIVKLDGSVQFQVFKFSAAAIDI